MQAGLLREIIEIERAHIEKNPDNGEEVIVWRLLWRGRARVEQTSGSLQLTNGETYNAVTKRITIRTKPVLHDLPSKLRVKYNGQAYRVLSIDPRITDMATIMMVEQINL